MVRQRKSSFAFRMACALVAVSSVMVARVRADANVPDSATTLRLPQEFQGVGVTEHLGGQVPLTVQFFDEHATKMPLSTFFDSGKPVILQLGYLDCPMLCDVVSKSLVDSLKKTHLNIGQDYQFVFVSIDPSNTPDLAGAKRTSYAQEFDKAGAKDGMHFLIGNDSDIHRLTDAVGFHYKQISNGQFAHPAVAFILTPDGRISKYMYGESFPPADLEQFLRDASGGNIGSPVEQILQFCGRLIETETTKHALLLMRMSGVVTLMAMGGAFFWLVRRNGHINPPQGFDSMIDSTK